MDLYCICLSFTSEKGRLIELHKCINSVSHYARLAHQAVGMQMLSIREVRKSMMNMTWTHRAITKIPSIVDLDQTSFARILSYLGLEVNILCWLRKLSILNWTGDPENFDQLNPVMAFAGTGFGVYWIRFFPVMWIRIPLGPWQG